jgi:hypothetical protein
MPAGADDGTRGHDRVGADERSPGDDRRGGDQRVRADANGRRRDGLSHHPRVGTVVDVIGVDDDHQVGKHRPVAELDQLVAVNDRRETDPHELADEQAAAGLQHRLVANDRPLPDLDRPTEQPDPHAGLEGRPIAERQGVVRARPELKSRPRLDPDLPAEPQPQRAVTFPLRIDPQAGRAAEVDPPGRLDAQPAPVAPQDEAQAHRPEPEPQTAPAGCENSHRPDDRATRPLGSGATGAWHWPPSRTGACAPESV